MKVLVAIYLIEKATDMSFVGFSFMSALPCIGAIVNIDLDKDFHRLQVVQHQHELKMGNMLEETSVKIYCKKA